MTSLTDRLKVHLHSTRFSLLNFFLLRSLKSGNPLSCKFFANFSVWNSVWKRGESQKPFLQNWGRPPFLLFRRQNGPRRGEERRVQIRMTRFRNERELSHAAETRQANVSAKICTHAPTSCCWSFCFSPLVANLHFFPGAPWIAAPKCEYRHFRDRCNFATRWFGVFLRKEKGSTRARMRE